MNIRPVKESDLKALVALNREVQGLHAGLRPDVFKSAEKHDMTDGIAGLLAKAQFRAILAEEGRRPLGYAIYEIREQSETHFKRARHLTYIHQMSVASEHRRKGIGKALLQHIRQQSRDLGIDCIELDFWSANTAARAFYKSLGFMPIREVLELREDGAPTAPRTLRRVPRRK